MGGELIRISPWTASRDLIEQPRQGPLYSLQPFALGKRPRITPRDDNSVHTGGQPGAFNRKGFPQEPLDPISLHGSPDLAGDRKTQPRLLSSTAGEDIEHERSVRMRAAIAKDSVEVSAA